MEDKLSRVDINQASLKELTLLPGLGRKIAQRIISGRPYASVDDLGQIQGVRNDLLEKWRPALFVAEAETAEPELENVRAMVKSSPIEEKTSPPDEVLQAEMAAPGTPDLSVEPAAEIPVVQEAVPQVVQLAVAEPVVSEKPPEKTVPVEPAPTKRAGENVLKRNETMGCGLVLALLVLILAVGLSLGVLQLVNGGLNYAAAGQYAALQRQVDSLGTRTTTIEQDVNNLRTRLDSMEALGGRVSTLENDNKALRSDLDARAAEIQQLKSQLGDMDGRITQVEQRSQTFSRFLDGLRNLLGGILPNP